MDNQHQKIKGYRDLSQAEIDLMNKIKAHGAVSEALIDEVNDHINRQHDVASISEVERLVYTNPAQWLMLARTNLQVGIMELVRAVAQPSSF